MSRLRFNNEVGKLGASLTNSGTTITFASAPSFPTVASPDYIPLILEPAGSSPSANFEVVWLTAYTSGATTGTISRGEEGTSGVAHSSGVAWACGPTAQDADTVVFGTTAAQPAANVATAPIYYATDTGELFFSDGTTWRTIGYLSAVTFNGSPAAKVTPGALFYWDFSVTGTYMTFDSGTQTLRLYRAPLAIASVGMGLKVAEGTNAKQGVATLAGGTVTVANTSVTANSRILLTAQDNSTTGSLRVSARTAGTSFTITSSNGTDAGVVAYEIFESA